MHKANIDCVLLSGTADSDNHAWNGVKIGGDWYQIDVTWNDTDGENNYAENDYFNLTDDLMFKDHKLSYKYSELNSQTYLSVATWCNFMFQSVRLKSTTILTISTRLFQILTTPMM